MTDQAEGVGELPGDGLADTVGRMFSTLVGRRIPRQRQRRLRLLPSPEAPTMARCLLISALDDWSLPHLREPAELVVSELVSNAVLHAGTELELRLTFHDDGLCVAVRDNDPTPPQPRRVEVGCTTPGGRGLHLVNLLSYRWGWFTAKGEKLVWAFVTALTPARPATATATAAAA